MRSGKDGLEPVGIPALDWDRPGRAGGVCPPVSANARLGRAVAARLRLRPDRVTSATAGGVPVRLFHAASRPRVWLRAGLILGWAITPGLPDTARGTNPAPVRPNIIVILTDDQRFDEVDFMPHVALELKRKAIVFRRAYVSNPLCCPVRAAILSGGFASHRTHVRTNTSPNGGVWRFDDRDTLATRLQRAGYRTILVGKYLNGYPRFTNEPAHRDYIPPGWSVFHAWAGGGWRRFWIVDGASGPDESATGSRRMIEELVTRYDADAALRLIEESLDRGRPFFLLCAVHPPHTPALPDRDALDDEIFTRFGPGGSFAYRGRGWGEQPDGDVSDKPGYIRWAAGNWWGGDPDFYDSDPFRPGIPTPDDYMARRLQSLLAVDRAIGRMFRVLEKRGALERTLIILTSDHGFLMGEHMYFGKRVPYEEAIRVPLLVYVPWLEHRTIDLPVLMDVDLPVTLLDFAGAQPPARADGRSLRPLLEGRGHRPRAVLFFQSAIAGRTPGWIGALAGDIKYAFYDTFEEELYDLSADPFELTNLASDPAARPTIKQFRMMLRSFRPLRMVFPPEDFGPWVPGDEPVLPDAALGEPYQLALTAAGGKPPYRWAAVGDGWPKGLTVGPDQGLIHGTPLESGDFRIEVQVRDRSVSPYDGRPQRWIQVFRLTVR